MSNYVYHSVKLRVFIPYEAISVEVLGVDVPLEFSVHGGDNRTFSPSAGTSRAELEVCFAWPKSDRIFINRSFGETVGYRAWETITVRGKPRWVRSLITGDSNARRNDGASLRLGPGRDFTPQRNAKTNLLRPMPNSAASWQSGAGESCRKPHSRMRKTLQATDQNTFASFEYGKCGNPSFTLRFFVKATNPLIDESIIGALKLAPHVKANLTLKLQEKNGAWMYSLHGQHSKFPNFELYVNQNCLYKHDSEAMGNELAHLMLMNNVSISNERF